MEPGDSVTVTERMFKFGYFLSVANSATFH